MKKKILWLLPFFGKHAVGGAERANANLIKSTNEYAHLVYYNKPKEKDLVRYKFEGIQAIHGPDDQIPNIVKDFDPNLIILTHDLIHYGKTLGYPYIIYLHDPRAHCQNANTSKCLFNCYECSFFSSDKKYELAYRGALGVAYCSNYLRVVAEQQYPDADYLKHPWMPIQFLTQRTFCAPANIVGTTAGVPHKGSDLLLKIAAIMKNTKFLLVGPCNIKKLPKNIIYLGYLDDAHMYRDFYCKIGTYISLAIQGEAFGMTVVEANAYGIPTLIPRCDGFLESGKLNINFVDKENFGNHFHWSSRLNELMTNVSLRESSISHGYINFYDKVENSSIVCQEIKSIISRL